jgi:hypothetical protein
VAEPSRVKVRRHRLHSRGDHRECLPHCPLAGTVERDDVRELRQAIDAEFRDDPARLAIARRHVEQAAQRGQPAVAAVVALDRMIESARSGRYVPVDGPISIDDEIIATANAIIRGELAGRVDRLEAEVAELGWEAALASLRAELAAVVAVPDGWGVQ